MEHTIVVVTSLVVAGMTMSVAAFVAAICDAFVASKFIEGLTRQPEAKNVLFVNTLISIGLVEALPIIATVIAIVILYANPLI